MRKVGWRANMSARGICSTSDPFMGAPWAAAADVPGVGEVVLLVCMAVRLVVEGGDGRRRQERISIDNVQRGLI